MRDRESEMQVAAVKATRPKVKIFAVEPQGAPKLQAAMKAGKLVNVVV